MPCVYILQFPNSRYYIGSTSDIDRRLAQHATGHTKSTKRLGTGVLVLKHEYETLADARAVESKLKKFKRKDYIARIVRDGYIKIVP